MVSVPTRASGRACGSSIGDGSPEGRCVSEICVHCASARFRPNARAVVGWEKERLSVAASHPAGASRRALRCCVITLCTEKRGPCVSLDDCSPSRSEAKLNRGRLCSNSIRSIPPPHNGRHQSAGEQDPASGPLMTPRPSARRKDTSCRCRRCACTLWPAAALWYQESGQERTKATQPFMMAETVTERRA